MSGVSVWPIKQAESSDYEPKLDTLRRLAMGLAKDRHGIVDAVAAADYEQRLLRAVRPTVADAATTEAGTRLSSQKSTLREQLEELFGNDPRPILDVLESTVHMDDDDRDFVFGVFRWLQSQMPRAAANRRKHALFPP